MVRIRGGMEFQQGRPVHLPPPPQMLPAQPLRLTCMARPDVIPGQPVEAGDLLANPQDESVACTISPIAGTVRQVTAWAGGRRFDVTVEPAESMVPSTLDVDAPQDRTLEKWYTFLRHYGPWVNGSGRWDLMAQLAAAQQRQPDTLICVGLDAFPPYPDNSSLLLSYPDDAVLGTQILADMVGAKRVLIAASSSAPVLARLRPSCRNFRMSLTVMRNVYPTADPTMMMWLHFAGKRGLRRGGNPVEQGVMLIQPWVAIRLARWFTHRTLDLVRPVLLAWPEPAAPLTPFYALTGQPLGSLHGSLAGSAAALAGRIVAGNPMTGRPLTALPGDDGQSPAVVPADELLLSVLGKAAAHKPEPCIHCGWCNEVCPTQLRPIDLAQLCESKSHEKVLQRQLPWCIDCGLCSHVCPSNLPLAQTLRVASEQMGIA